MSFLGSRRRISRARNIGNSNDILNYYVFDDIENIQGYTFALSGGTLKHIESGEVIKHMRPSVFAERAKSEIQKLRFQIKLLKEGRNPDLDSLDDIVFDHGSYLTVQHYNLNEINVRKSKMEQVISESGLFDKIWIGIQENEVVVQISKHGYFQGDPQVPTMDVIKIPLIKEDTDVFTYKVPDEYYTLVKDVVLDVKKAKMARELMK